ncbi:hypothetical protein HPB47_013261, partial [Ixodes persulcatus]
CASLQIQKKSNIPSRGVIPMGEQQEDALQGAASAERPTRSPVRKTKLHKTTGEGASCTPPDKTTVARPIEKPAVFPRTLTPSYTHDIHSILDRGSQVDCIFLDFAKAFDKL